MRFPALSSHYRAVLQAFLVTFLWSTSWVFIKIGLEDIPALPFAAARYLIAFGCLAIVAFRSGQLTLLRAQPPRTWASLITLGVVFYALTPGAYYLSLADLPAVTVSLILSFTPIPVALIGIWWLKERPTWMQWAGMGCYLAGVALYFYPASLIGNEQRGLLFAGFSMLANVLAALLGRQINRERALAPVTVTVVSMGSGAVVLLVGGVAAQGIPHLSWTHWGIILWLAVVNSAFAYTLWNHTLRALTAMESSVINNTMLFQIAVLAWLFLGEGLTGRGLLGMMIAGTGAMVVQLRR